MVDDNTYIPLSIPNINGNELKYISEAVKTAWVSTGGAYINRFEAGFAEYAKVSMATAVQSGTAALHIAMIACGVRAGDIVIVPTLTFIAAANPVLYMNAEPVFMDCNDSLCIDPEKLNAYLENECEQQDGMLYDKTLGKPIKAIVVVHIFGNAADMEAVMDIAIRYNLLVIEDACEAMGTYYTLGRYAGRMAGTIGDFGVFSFNGNKILTTGGGGMFVAQDTSKVQWAKHISTQAKSDELYYDHDEVGYNYRMTNLQAAMGLAQLEQLEDFISTKEGNYKLYQDLGIKLLPFAPYVRPNFWFYSFMSKNRDGLIQHLGKNNIQARPIWKLIHTLPMYKHCRAYAIEEAIEFGEKVVNLPCSSSLKAEDVARVVACVKDFEG